MGGKARRRIAKESMDFSKEQLAVYKEEQAKQRKVLAKHWVSKDNSFIQIQNKVIPNQL